MDIWLQKMDVELDQRSGDMKSSLYGRKGDAMVE